MVPGAVAGKGTLGCGWQAGWWVGMLVVTIDGVVLVGTGVKMVFKRLMRSMLEELRWGSCWGRTLLTVWMKSCMEARRKSLGVGVGMEMELCGIHLTVWATLSALEALFQTR